VNYAPPQTAPTYTAPPQQTYQAPGAPQMVQQPQQPQAAPPPQQPVNDPRNATIAAAQQFLNRPQ